MPMFDLHGRVAAVTGASSGIGVQMAKALAGQGADIAIMARRKEKLDEVAAEIRALGVRCLAVQCDVTSTESIKNAVGEIVKEYGELRKTSPHPKYFIATDRRFSHEHVYQFCDSARICQPCRPGRSAG